ncbi:hypothetical protein KIN20_025340, partial [Parelaphostrongylus tenuis]
MGDLVGPGTVANQLLGASPTIGCCLMWVRGRYMFRVDDIVRPAGCSNKTERN